MPGWLASKSAPRVKLASPAVPTVEVGARFQVKLALGFQVTAVVLVAWMLERQEADGLAHPGQPLRALCGFWSQWMAG